MHEDAAIARFAAALRGRLIRPDAPDYDDKRSIYNAMIDRRPRAIAECADVADVIAAVRFGREHGLDVAIRGGGHNGAGLAVVDDGLVIDLSSMRGIRVQPESRTLRAEPGCRWGDVDHASHAFGLATVSGIIANTGVGGLTLGGGHGYLSRRYGLTIDNLLAADVVLADGRLVRASEQEDADLFWALRGGGGNFGVVTSLVYRLHPVSEVVGGPMFWPIDQLRTTLSWYREWLPQLPRDVYAFFLIGAVPPADPFPVEIRGRTVCGLMWCCLDRALADAELARAREIAPPLFEHIGPVPYPALQSAFDGLYPPGLQWYWKGDFFREIPDEAIDVHERFAAIPSPHSTMHLYPVDGAVHDVGADDTAWGHRDANWSMVIAGVDADPDRTDDLRAWARDYWDALHPHSAGGAYINFMMAEGEDRIRASYGRNYDRLRRIKAEYDPDNFFHVNQNIEPEPSARPSTRPVARAAGSPRGRR